MMTRSVRNCDLVVQLQQCLKFLKGPLTTCSASQSEIKKFRAVVSDKAEDYFIVPDCRYAGA